MIQYNIILLFCYFLICLFFKNKVNMRNLYSLKIIFCFIILSFLLYNDYIVKLYLILTLKQEKNNYLIEVDISGSKKGNRGPSKFVRGIKEILPYNINNCTFIPLIHYTSPNNVFYLR